MDEQINEIKKWLGTGSINIFGEPFSGKDTQGKELARLLSARLISSGEILRSMSGYDDIKQYVGLGNQAPTEIYLNKVLPFLSKNEFSDHPLILSMVGRIVGEEQPTIDAAEQSGHPMKIVVWLQLTEEEVWRRFKKSKSIGDRGKRQDDTEEALKVRLKKFKSDSLPVLNYYDDKKLLIKVDGGPETAVVTKSMINALYDFIQ